MPKFEVYIPAAENQGLNVTFRVDADNWMAALKTGMQKLGESGNLVQNVLVDIRDDNSLHVTESNRGRVFRIRELTELEAAQAETKRQTKPETPRLDPAVALATVTEVPAGSGAVGSVGIPYAAASGVVPLEASHIVGRGPLGASRHEPQAVQELERPARPIEGDIGRPKPPEPKKDPHEDILAEVFDRVQEVYTKKSVDDALYFLLDLAMEKVGVEAGSVLRSDPTTGDLTFTAVRGPKASELKEAKLTLPAGVGVVGFSAVEGVSVALSDVQKDPRHYAAVSEKLNYDVTSVLCSPMMTHGRSFGCIELVNRKNSPVFTAYEIGLLSYISHQAALYLNRET